MRYYTFTGLVARAGVHAAYSNRYTNVFREYTAEIAPALLFLDTESDLTFEDVLPAVREYYKDSIFRTLQYRIQKIDSYRCVIVSVALRLPHPKDSVTHPLTWVVDFQGPTPTSVRVAPSSLYTGCSVLERLSDGCPCRLADTRAEPINPLVSLCSVQRTLSRLPAALEMSSEHPGLWVVPLGAQHSTAPVSGFEYVPPKLLAGEPFGGRYYFPEAFEISRVERNKEADADARVAAAATRNTIRTQCVSCVFSSPPRYGIQGATARRPCSPYVAQRCRGAKSDEQARAAIDAAVAPFDVRKIHETTDFTKEQVNHLLYSGHMTFPGRHAAFGGRATELRAGYFTKYAGLEWRFRVFAAKSDVSRYHDFRSAAELSEVMPDIVEPEALYARTPAAWEYDAYSLLIQKREARYATRNNYSYEAKLQMIYWGSYGLHARYGTTKAVGTRQMHEITSSTPLKRLYEIAYGDNAYDRADHF